MSGTESLWYKDAIFYEVYPRGFHDANGDGDGDLAGLTNKLDYLQDLGIDCLWLMPIYASPLKDDGYDIADFRQIHPTIGTVADFEVLTKAAHARGIRIIADLVINHTSDQHPWFQEARRDPTSPKRNYYVWSDTDQLYQGTRIIFRDTETSNWTWDPVARQYFWHRFYSHQPDLNYDNPMVRKEMLDIMAFWLDRGIDGFRVDAVPYLIEQAKERTAKTCPRPTHFLKEIRQFVDSHYPCDAAPLAEANQWPADLLPYFGQGTNFHHGLQLPRLMPNGSSWQHSPRKTSVRSSISSTKCPKSRRRASGRFSCATTTSSLWKWSRTKNATTCIANMQGTHACGSTWGFAAGLPP